MKRLRGLAIILVASVFLASCATTSQFQHAKGGQVIKMNTYSVEAPQGDDWNFQTDMGSNAVIFLKQKQNIFTGVLFGWWIPGATMITVYTNMPLREKCFLSEEELADDIRDIEVKNMMEMGVNAGEYKLEELNKGTVSMDGKKLYTMSYNIARANKVSENVIYIYFPPEFKEDRLFYEFLISEAYFKGAFGAVTKRDLTQVYPVIKSFRSVGLLQGLLQKTKPSENAPALILATWNGDTATVKELLAKGANANSKGSGGMSALHYAAITGRKDIVSLLLDKGADVNAKDDEGRDVLKVATLNGNEVMAMLLDKGADINSKDGKRGWTPLEFAVGAGRTEAANLLIDRGADINQKDLRGGTALALAVYHNRNEIAQKLMEKGAEVNSQLDDGWSPLMDAVDSGNTEITRLLIDKGADVNLKSKNGWTALMAAALYGRAEIAKLLIGKGADVNAKNMAGNTALQTATMRKHEEVVRLLKEAGARE